MTAGGDFVGVMTSAFAVAAATGAGGEIATTPVTIASHSIDPPSIVLSLPAGAALPGDGAFAVSLLSTSAPAVSSLDFTGGGAHPVARGALAGLACRLVASEEVFGRHLAVAEVVGVDGGEGGPLLRGGPV